MRLKKQIKDNKILKADLKNTVAFSVQTISGLVFSTQLLSMNMGGALASGLFTLGVGYLNYKAIEDSTYRRFSAELSNANSNHLHYQLSASERKTINENINKIFKNTKKSNKLFIINQTLAGVIAGSSIFNYMNNEPLLAGLWGAMAGAITIINVHNINESNKIISKTGKLINDFEKLFFDFKRGVYEFK